MTPSETAEAIHADAYRLGAAFMMDIPTFERGGELGFDGVVFYVAGRFGVLGPVDADVVTATAVFFNPDVMRPMWDAALQAGDVRDASLAFTECCAAWGRRHLVGAAGLDRLAELLERVLTSASPLGLPLFAAWRALPLADDPAGRAAQLVNLMREYRGAAHGVAVVAAGMHPLHAVLTGPTAGTAQLLGWAPPHPDVPDNIRGVREDVEATTTSIVAPSFEALDDDERADLVDLLRNAAATAFPAEK